MKEVKKSEGKGKKTVNERNRIFWPQTQEDPDVQVIF